MKTPVTEQEYKAAIEKQQQKMNRLLQLYHFDCNHPDLDDDNEYLEELVLEYMFYFNSHTRKILLTKPASFLSLQKLQEIAREKGVIPRTNDRIALTRAIQMKDAHAPCYATRGSCGKSCPWLTACMYEFFKKLEETKSPPCIETYQSAKAP